MDSLTHGLLGGITGKSVSANQRRFWVMVLLGLFPDIDIITNYFGSAFAPFQHRGLTHSLFGWLLFSFTFAFMFRKFDPGPFIKRLGCYALSLGLHLWADFITSFGIPLFAPWSYKHYQWGIMNSFSIGSISIFAMGLFFITRKKFTRWVQPHLVWICWLLFIGLNWGLQIHAKSFTNQLQASTTVLPSTTNPFVWNAVEVDSMELKYRVSLVDLWNEDVKLKRSINMPNILFPPVEESLKSPLVQVFLKIHRWPVVRVTQKDNLWLVEWGDIIFSTRGLVRGKVDVKLNDKGEILHEEKSFKFWTPA